MPRRSGHALFMLHSLQMHTRGLLVERDGMETVIADNDPGAKSRGKTVEAGLRCVLAKAWFLVCYLAAGEAQSAFDPRNQARRGATGEHPTLPRPARSARAIYHRGAAPILPEPVGAPHVHALKPDLYLAHIPIAFSDPSLLFGPYKLRLRDDFWGEWTPIPVEGFSANERQRPESCHAPDRSERPVVLLDAEGRVGGRPWLQPEFPWLRRRRGLPRASSPLAPRRTRSAPPGRDRPGSRSPASTGPRRAATGSHRRRRSTTSCSAVGVVAPDCSARSKTPCKRNRIRTAGRWPFCADRPTTPAR